MEKLFGIPVDGLLVGLLVALGVAAVIVGVLAVRNPILVKLGVRNVERRRGRSTLIVVGLMLGTTIVAAALTTGDTMSHSIRVEAVQALGSIDEVVSPRGATDDIAGELGDSTGRNFLDAAIVEDVDAALAGKNLTDGVAPVILDDVAAQAPASRQTEPRVRVFGSDPERMDGFSPIEPVAGGRAELGDLAEGEVFLNADGADELDTKAGETLLLYAEGKPVSVTVRDVVTFTGTGEDGPAVLLPLAGAQKLLGREDQIDGVMISNRGGIISGAALSDEVVAALHPVELHYDVDVTPAKQDVLELADEAGSAFMAFFTTFGSFSIAAGILLIFLIFVMLAAERRGELGIARAIGSRRGHLVESFTFEGVAYDLLAALVGALLGAAVAFAMIAAMAGIFGAQDFDIEFSVTWRSLAIAYSLGVLLTLIVVALSAWRVSLMTISTAIRNAPEPPRAHRRRWLLGTLGVIAGLLLFASGVAGSQATPLLLGMSIVLVSVVPLARMAGVPDRVAFTTSGLAIVVIWMLPWHLWEDVFGPLSMNFSTWIASGLMVVVGAVWTIMYNADLLLDGTMRVFGRIRALAPILKISMAYPLAGRFRTGTTLAMFTLVVFTLVTGTVSSASFIAASANVDAVGGGFDIRSATAPTAPLGDPQAALRAKLGADAADFPVVGSQSVLAVDANQTGAGGGPAVVRRPRPRLELPRAHHVRPRRDRHRLRVGPRGVGRDRVRARAGGGRQLRRAAPRQLQLRRRAAGLPADRLLLRRRHLRSDQRPDPGHADRPHDGPQDHRRPQGHGAVRDGGNLDLAGDARGRVPGTRRADDPLLPGRARRRSGRRRRSTLESAFIQNGLEAESIQSVVDENQAASLTINRLILAFMGLGLIVGVAALGVISARAVVERRQHIGVLRAVGFRRGMVEAAFLLESSFVALTAIVVGTALGLLLANNIVSDQRRQPSWEGIELVVPWVNLGIIFFTVYAVALLATLAPAVRASRIRPAEALRYE